MIPEHLLQSLRRQRDELAAELGRPGAATSASRYRRLIADHARLQRICELAERRDALSRERDEARRLAEDPAGEPELRELATADVERLSGQLADTERQIVEAMAPPPESDERNVIMEIRAGTGGEEAALFAADLFRMYSRYADRKGWRVSVLDVSASDIGGYKEIIFSVEGPGAHGWLRFESGTHRVQRIPVTEQQGRIHTSTATVAVLPEAEEIDEIAIAPDEIRMDLFRASGAGGQKVNKTESAVRLTHLPTGIVVQCQDERSQTRNKEKAMRVLRARLLDLKLRDEAARRSDARRAQIGSGDRSERIRTYNFPQSRVTDHRINYTTHRLPEILDGDLDELIGELRRRDHDERIRRALEELVRT
ncbi:MAG: peptide chain release factor 1 [Kiritimatiellae bacterium]|nr:peptide chain release factor 1 [Kiritimatiellia bacterium]